MYGIPNTFRSARISASGLKANRIWMNAISNNVANMHTLETGKRDKLGNPLPYMRQHVVFQKVLSEQFRENRVNSDVLNGVAVKEVVDVGKPKFVYSPHHPYAYKKGPHKGYVAYPGVSVAQEMADLRHASASYQANLTAMATTYKMLSQGLNMKS